MHLSFESAQKPVFMSRIYITPRAFVDTLEHTCALYKKSQAENKVIIIRDWLNRCLHNEKIPLPSYAVTEYGYVLHFLYEYRGSSETFNAYRREIDRLMCWSWFVQEKSLLALKRLDIEAFIEFCQKPPKRWINLKKVSRFRAWFKTSEQMRHLGQLFFIISSSNYSIKST